MRALIDYHHSDLAESLHRLLEDRLGIQVFVPYGMEWFEQGIWNFGRGHMGDGLARQFLMDDREVDDLQPHRRLRRLTLEEARRMDFAVVLASVPDNYVGYHHFAQEKGAKFVIEVGNVNQWVDRSLDPLVLDSTGNFGGVQFTPEFDMDGAFRYQHPRPHKRVASMVNLFPHLPCYPLYTETMTALHSWVGRVYGHGSDDFLKGPNAMATHMADASFIWHDKISGDGFGYVIHYAASVGRPLIGHASHYRGQVAEDLWKDGVTCIDLDRHSPEETARLMEAIIADPERHEMMCAAIATRVRTRINFDHDAQRVADALGLLVPA